MLQIWTLLRFSAQVRLSNGCYGEVREWHCVCCIQHKLKRWDGFSLFLIDVADNGRWQVGMSNAVEALRIFLRGASDFLVLDEGNNVCFAHPDNCFTITDLNIFHTTIYPHVENSEVFISWQHLQKQNPYLFILCKIWQCFSSCRSTSWSWRKMLTTQHVFSPKGQENKCPSTWEDTGYAISSLTPSH